MRFRKRKKPAVYKMTLEQSVETVALLAKHLRTYTPALAAIGSSPKKLVKQELISRLSKQILEDQEAIPDIVKIITNLTGVQAGEVSESLLERLVNSWKSNGMNEALVLCFKVGLLERSDIANASWVLSNWSQDGTTRRTS